MQHFYDRYRWAEDLFAHRDYRGAARVLQALLAEDEARPDKWVTAWPRLDCCWRVPTIIRPCCPAPRRRRASC